MAETAAAPAREDHYGITLVRQLSYNYRGKSYKKGTRYVEPESLCRYLIGTGEFRWTDVQVMPAPSPVPAPVPVAVVADPTPDVPAAAPAAAAPAAPVGQKVGRARRPRASHETTVGV